MMLSASLWRRTSTPIWQDESELSKLHTLAAAERLKGFPYLAGQQRRELGDVAPGLSSPK